MSAHDWLQHLPGESVIAAWEEYERLSKRLTVYLIPMRGGRVYARYEPLMRTGRTSASRNRKLPSVPIQQIPRDGPYRSLFLADEGTQRLTIDFSYIELRTLASCCLFRFGHSRMAEAIRGHTEAVRQGRKDVPDPHQLTASQILGLSPADFLALPAAEQKAARQQAKAANFGYPGGLGARRFVDYAKGGYGVTLTVQQARDLRNLWLDTYPEMREWQADKTAE